MKKRYNNSIVKPDQLVFDERVELFGYLVSMELLQSGKPLGQIDDRVRVAMDYFITARNARLAITGVNGD